MDLAGSSLRVTAGPNETNLLTITSASGVLTILDGGSLALNAGLGCSQTATARVTCGSSGVTSVVIDAGDGDDTVTLTGLALPATLTDGPGNDTVTGGSGNDTFIGSPGNDTLTGGPGNDSFGDAGGAGADTLVGGLGTDTADYSGRTVPLAVRLDDVSGDGAAGESDNVRSDIEAVNGGIAADLLVGGAGAETLRGNGGDDIFDGRGGADTYAGGSGQDTADYSVRTAAVSVTLDGTANDGEPAELDNVGTDVDIVLGGEGADTITGHASVNELRGNGGNDTLNGGGGNDALDGGAGADYLIGGTGTDAADYSSRAEPITADLNGTTGFGESGENDTVATDVEGVWGGAGDDRLTGNAAGNVLRGNAGDDMLDGRLGADDVSGGDGIDSVSYAARTVAVTVKLDNSNGDGQSGENDTIRGDIEILSGGAGDDKLYANDADNVITGNGGNDTVYGYGGNDTITVSGGTDSVWGGTGDDAISAGDGANKLYGEDGADRLTTGSGADTLDGGAGADVLTSGTGNDSVSGGSGDDSLVASDGNDKLTGGDGNDSLDAGAGDDSGDAGTGDDRISAGDGNDSLSGGDGIDWLDGGGGADRLSGNNGNDNLDGGIGDDSLDGGAGDDGLTGGDGADTLTGSDGGDALDGGAAGDTLNGGRGNDVLTGGDGNDKLNGNEDADTVSGGPGDDQSWGGSGDDVLGDGEGANKLYGEDGVDKLVTGAGNDSLSGGNGADFLDAGPGDDLVNGDNDADRLQGGEGTDKLYGSNGDDVIDGGLGPDQIDGSDGTDTVDYGGRTGGVSITNDGKADDGAKDEGDNVSTSIDDAIGSSGDDRITFATDWPHKLDGGDGNDLLRGGPREDRLTGGRGKDALFGEGGADAYDGGAGPDHLSAADGVAETLLCGTGKDVGVLDKSDKATGCEKRTVKQLTSSAPAMPSVPTPVTTPTAGPTNTARAPSGLVGVRRVATRGRFVSVPGAPGVRADRRILKDIAWLLKHYPIRISAGYALSGHAVHGEHPVGLALDIVPGPGGSWDDVDRLAKWAEPRQNYPRPPFRWVGYNGDANHGRGNHLHLSWMHAATSPGKPAAWVVTMKFRNAGGSAGSRGKAKKPAANGRGGAMVRYARSNRSLGGTLELDSGLRPIALCSGVGPLKKTLKAASSAFGLSGWRILAGLTETESAFGCNMGPSSAGAIGWTQFMPATWKDYGMDADGDGKADPYNSVDAVFSTARYLRASGAPGSWRRALFAYNHDQAYVNIVLERSKQY